MLVYYFVPFIVNNHYLLFQVSSGHNSVNIQNQTHVYANSFDHKDLGNHPAVMSTSRETPCICTLNSFKWSFCKVLCECESWMLRQADKRKTDAFRL